MAEDPERGLIQRMPSVFDRASELVQGRKGYDAQLDILEFRPFQEGDFKETWLSFGDNFVFTVGEKFASYFETACASLERNLGTVIDRLCKVAERQVPFDRVDLGHSGQEEQIGVGKETMPGTDYDAGAAHFDGQFHQEKYETLSAGISVQPVQFLA